MICARMETSRLAVGSSSTRKAGLQDQRAGEADTLLLPAGELMRIAVRLMRPKPDAPHHGVDAFAGTCIPLARDDQRLGDDRLHRHARIERRAGILEHHLHAAAGPAQLIMAEMRDIFAFEGDAACGRVDQAQHQPRQGALA